MLTGAGGRASKLSLVARFTVSCQAPCSGARATGQEAGCSQHRDSRRSSRRERPASPAAPPKLSASAPQRFSPSGECNCWNSRFAIETMRLNYLRNKQLRGMNNLIQRVSYPFVKAFPGVSCGSGYFSMYARGNA